MTHDPAARLVPVPRTARVYDLGAPDAPEVWLALHGYGQLGRYFARHFASHAGPQRRIVAPEAPARFYLGDDYKRVGASWMTREERDADIADTHAYLDAVLAGIDEPVHGLGFSQGGMVLARYAAARPGRFARLVLWGSAPPDDVDLATATLPPLTLVLGDTDAYFTPERRVALAARLDGVPHTTVTYDGGHRLHAETLAALL